MFRRYIASQPDQGHVHPTNLNQSPHPSSLGQITTALANTVVHLIDVDECSVIKGREPLGLHHQAEAIVEGHVLMLGLRQGSGMSGRPLVDIRAIPPKVGKSLTSLSVADRVTLSPPAMGNYKGRIYTDGKRVGRRFNISTAEQLSDLLSRVQLFVPTHDNEIV